MSNKIYLPSTGPDDWRRLLADPVKHWKDGFSAKSAALCWESARGLPAEIARQFVAAGLGPAELLLALPEWKTPLPGGDRDSQTDILAFVRTNRGVFACGVEAKVGETFGPSVGEWLKEASPGKQERLSFLCALLGLPFPPPATLRYQLFHRTGAAIIEAGRFGCVGAAMIVHSFSAEKMWLSELQAFAGALGATVEPDAPAMLRTTSGLPLLIGWATGVSAASKS